MQECKNAEMQNAECKMLRCKGTDGQGWQMRKVWQVNPMWRGLGALTVGLVAIGASLPPQPGQPAQAAQPAQSASPPSQAPPAPPGPPAPLAPPASHAQPPASR